MWNPQTLLSKVCSVVALDPLVQRCGWIHRAIAICFLMSKTTLATWTLSCRGSILLCLVCNQFSRDRPQYVDSRRSFLLFRVSWSPAFLGVTEGSRIGYGGRTGWIKLMVSKTLSGRQPPSSIQRGFLRAGSGFSWISRFCGSTLSSSEAVEDVSR